MNKRALFSIATAAAVLLLAAFLFPRIFQSSNTSSSLTPGSTAEELAKLTSNAAAEKTVQNGWLLARLAGAYDFHTRVEQTTYYAPELTNVGRPAQVQQLSLEGQTNLKDRSLQLAIWQDGSVLKPANAMEMRVDGEKAYGRTAGTDWQEIENISDGFAPGRDLLAYLNGARDVREITPAGEDTYRQFTFRVDGPAFANYIRLQLEDELRRSGKLPANMNLDSPRIFRDLVGDGEIWLASNGLPERLNVNIAFPQQTDGSRVKATIRSEFSNFGEIENREGALFSLPGTSSTTGFRNVWLDQIGLRLDLVDWPEVGRQLALTLVTVMALMLLVISSRRPRVYAAFALTVIITMLVGPMAESARVFAFNQEQASDSQEKQSAQASEQATREMTANLLGPDWNPSRDPLAAAEAKAAKEAGAAAQSLVQSALAAVPGPAATQRQPLSQQLLASVATGTGDATTPGAVVDIDKDGVPDTYEEEEADIVCVGRTDCDLDGLTDLQEYRLGTELNDTDTDGDGLRDEMEVRGFGSGSGLGAAGKWYSNPRSIDTNKDGLPDTMECWTDDTFNIIKETLDKKPSSLLCDRDSDGDNIPDLFEQDNDGDGVDDTSDLSPFNGTPADIVFNNVNPFKFSIIDGVTPNKPLFVDFQLVPTSAKQLSYARNVLDWPTNDTIGQVQRTTDTTFATGRAANSYPVSLENGDMRLMPLVEIKIPPSDANNVLPVTRDLTAIRGTTGYRTVKVNEVDELQAWLQAEINLRANNGSTEIKFTSLKNNTGGAITLERAKIYPLVSCPVPPGKVSATQAYDTINASAIISGTTWTVVDNLGANVPLTRIMDGKHVIVLEQGSGDTLLTACLQPGDIPNGDLPKEEMFDTVKLDSYGVNLRDLADKDGKLTAVLAYVTASVVSGRTGGEKQAFTIRMPYFMRNGVNELGAAQEIRLVWLAQLLNDDESIQIIHAYPNEGWKLAGMNARQDFGMRSAVFYQNPTDADNADANMQKIQKRIWSLASVMSKRFLNQPVKRPRLSLENNLKQTMEISHAFPVDSLGVMTSTYQTQDEIARIPSEVTPAVLAHFIDPLTNELRTGYTHALLFFAREEEYKAIAWSGEDATKLSLPKEKSVLASYSWKPFHYVSGKWQSYSVTAYIDELNVNMTDDLKKGKPADTGIPADVDPVTRDLAIKGIVLADQSYALGMLFGGNQVVKTGDIAIPDPDESDETQAQEEQDGNIQQAGSNSGVVLKLAAAEILETVYKEKPVKAKLDIFIKPALSRSAGLTKIVQMPPLLQKQVALGNLYSGMKPPAELQRTKGFDAEGGGINKLGAARFAAGGVALGMTIATLAGQDMGKTGEVVQAVTASLEAAGAVKDLRDAYKAAKAAGSWTKSLNAVSKAGKAAAVAGLVLDIGLAVGVFMVMWGSGSFNIKDLGFTAALAATIAKVAVAVFLFALALMVPAGTVLVMVIGMIDGLVTAICSISKAASKKDEDFETKSEAKNPTTGQTVSACSGISGYLTEAVTWLIFGQNVLVDNMFKEGRLNTGDFKLNIQDSNRGFEVGNTMLPTIFVQNTIYLIDQPSDWKSLFHFYQISWDNLALATHKYDLVTSKDDKREVSLGQMTGDWQEFTDLKTRQLSGSRRSPGIQYDDPLGMVPVTAEMAGGMPVEFTEAGVNVSIPLYLRETYANPAQECWWIPPIAPVPWMPPICYIRSSPGSTPVDMKLQFDVFPNTLDGFYSPSQPNPKGGYSLAWGQTGGMKFPVMKDFDGDGLSSTATNGNDPNDSLWDTDNDGLSDLFEGQKGTNPRLVDTDGDDMSDRDELIMEIDPLRVDTDGDGLRDGEEVFHEGPQGWSGGWQFVYDLVNGAPLATWVSSDPTSMDRDNDKLTDYQERLYGLNPRVVSDAKIVKLDGTVREANAPAMLLRLDERAGAGLFSDSSGLLNNANCVGDACPISGHEGKYVNGPVFDGANDTLQAREPISLTNASFTVAFWASRSVAGIDHTVFSSGNPAANQGLQIGFRSNNTFTCSFYPTGLNSPVYTDTAWHHWACTYDAANHQRKLYRDGSLVAQDSAANSYQGKGAWNIGAAAWGGANFNGTLDELAVFPTVLSQAQIQAEKDGRYNPGGAQVAVAPNDPLDYAAILENNLLGKSLNGLLSTEATTGFTLNNPQTPVTYALTPAGNQTLTGRLENWTAASGTYSLTMTAGAAVIDPREATNYAALYLPLDGNYKDAAGSQPPLSITPAGITPNPEFDWGYKGKAANFANGRTLTLPVGLTKIADCPDCKDFSFATWVYWRGGTGSQYAFKFDEGGISMNLDLNATSGLRFSLAGQTLVSARPAQGTWVHVAVTVDNKNKTGILYVNGIPGTPNTTMTFSPADYAWASAALGTGLNGLLDEVYFYNKAITASQVASLAGPSAQFSFDDPNRRLAYASDPLKNAQQKYGSPSWVDGIAKSDGLSLDGSTVLEVPSAPGDPTFNLSQGAFTYALWLKPSGVSSGGAGVRAVFGQPNGRAWEDKSTSGVYLLVKNGTDLQFGWGNSDPKTNAVFSANNWNTGWIVNALRADGWNQVLITTDGTTVTTYVNGVFKDAQSHDITNKPAARNNLSLGDNNFCATLSMRNVLTNSEQTSDAGPDSEYVYDFYDEANVYARMVYDDNADSGDWEPGSGPPGETFNSPFTFCGTGARVHAWEYDDDGDDVTGGGDRMGPDLSLAFTTPQNIGYPPANEYYDFAHQFGGAGTVNLFYELHNPVLPFNGGLDDLRLYRRKLNAQEADLLFAAYGLPYRFNFDDPPGTGVISTGSNASLFNFKNEGSIANNLASGSCDPGACPTSGLPGRINQALLFTSGQSIQVKDFEMDLTSDWPGMAFWINPSTSTGGGQVLKVTRIGLNLNVAVKRSDNAFCIGPLTLETCSPGNFPPNKWYHALVRFTPSQAFLYINGTLAASSATSFSSTNRYNLTAGGGFSGLLDDLRFPFSTLASGPSIQQLMAEAPQVVLHLEEAGANVSSFANVGNASPGAAATCVGDACPKAGVKGKYGQAAGFDGKDDGLSVPSNAIAIPDSFSLAVWVRPASIDRQQNILLKTNGAQTSFKLSLEAGGAPSFSRVCGQTQTFTDPNIKLPIDQWSHLVVTYDYGTKNLVYYLNGLPQITRPNFDSSCTNVADVLIGNGGLPFNGSMDEVQIFTHALKEYEVKDLFDIQANWVEEKQNYTIVVDADAPTSTMTPTLPLPVTYYPDVAKQIGVNASDPTTSVSMLELGVSRPGVAQVWTAGEACQDSGSAAAGSPAWCPWFKPASPGGEGRYTLQTRATDQVGQRETPSISREIRVDATAPNLTTGQSDGSKQSLAPSTTDANTQVLHLSGTVTDPLLTGGDPGSGVSGVWVSLHDPQGTVVGDAPYPVTLSGSNWSLDYPFRKEQVSGDHRFEISTLDVVGNQAVLTGTLTLDGTPPGVEIDEIASGIPITTPVFITTTSTLVGVITELPPQMGALATYHFEEGAGATSFANSADFSGGPPNLAACTSCPASGVPGYLGNGVNFNGAAQYLTVAMSEIISGTLEAPKTIAGTFTVAAWIRPGATSGTLGVMGSRSSEFGFDFKLMNGNLIHGDIGDGAGWLTTSADASFPYAAGQWVHVAYVVSTNGYILYANGVEAGRGTFVTPGVPVLIDAGHPLFIGATGAGEFMNGMLDEVLVYNRVLTADEINVLAAPNNDTNGVQSAAVAFTPLWSDETTGAPSPYFQADLPGQVAYLPLDDGRGQGDVGTFRNQASPGTGAVCTGTGCPNPGGRSPAGNALRFDGVDDEMVFSLKQPLTGSFTVAAWVRPEEATKTLGVMGSKFGFEFNFSGGNTIHAQIGNGTSWLATNADAVFNYIVGQWVHVAYVVSPTNYQIYVNGQPAGTAALSGTPLLVDDNTLLHLGMDATGNRLTGGLSDVQIFSRALSGPEILSFWRGRRAVLSLPLDERFVAGELQTGSPSQTSSPLNDASGWNRAVTLVTGSNDTNNKSHVGNVGTAALTLDGVDDGITASDVGRDLAGTAALSFGGWFGPSQLTQRALLGFDRAGGTLSSMLVLNAAGLLCYLDNQDGIQNNQCATAAITPGIWHFVMVTIDASNRGVLYVDGTTKSFSTQWRPLSSDIFKIGYSSTFSRFSGTVDDVRVYGRALLPEEVADLANAYWHKTAILNGSQADWLLDTPDGMEGSYRLDLRGRDQAGEESYNRLDTAESQAIDSQAPVARLTRQDRTIWGDGSGKKSVYTFTAADQFLSEDGLSTPCGTGGKVARTYRTDTASGDKILIGLKVSCSLTRPKPPLAEVARVCDAAGNCTQIGMSRPGALEQEIPSVPFEAQPVEEPTGSSPAANSTGYSAPQNDAPIASNRPGLRPASFAADETLSGAASSYETVFGTLSGFDGPFAALADDPLSLEGISSLPVNPNNARDGWQASASGAPDALPRLWVDLGAWLRSAWTGLFAKQTALMETALTPGQVVPVSMNIPAKPRGSILPMFAMADPASLIGQTITQTNPITGLPQHDPFSLPVAPFSRTLPLEPGLPITPTLPPAFGANLLSLNAPSIGSASAGVTAPHFTNSQAASIVLGQADLVSAIAATTSTGMRGPRGISVDPGTGKVFVADTDNHRVLRFASFAALVDGADAEIVLGQTSFTVSTPTTNPATAGGLNSPTGVAVDQYGRLWVSDTGNHRVLRFDNASTIGTGAAANGVLGQPNFSAWQSSLTPTANNMSLPRGLFFDLSNTLWVADMGRNRVLRFTDPVNSPTANGVLGQPDFSSSSGAIVNAATMSFPYAVYADEFDRLWVADYGNNRILRFNNARFQPNGAAADGQFGQPDFVSRLAPNPPTAYSLNGPIGLSMDADGGLYATDAANHRVLYYADAVTKPDGPNADLVLGQVNFTNGSLASTAAGLNVPIGAFYDISNGVLWVADTSNNRVVGYSHSLSASLVLGQPDFFSAAGQPTGTQNGLYQATGVAVDPTSGKVFIADYSHSRVLRFASLASLANGAPAELVLGQPDFTSTTSAVGPSAMWTPTGVMVDAAGRLWVADRQNNRVLRFDDASNISVNGAPANGVLGQPTFDVNFAGTPPSASGMYRPNAIHVNASGTLWVGDTENHRVLRFDNAAAKADGAPADGVLGQPSLTVALLNTTQSGMYRPNGVYEDADGRLWVADTHNNRVLRFDNATAKANGANADGVLGQVDFVNAIAVTPPGQNTLYRPSGVTGDVSGNLYVSDEVNTRVLVFQGAAALANGANAGGVVGQPNFVNTSRAVTAQRVGGVGYLSYDPGTGTLWVPDSWNNRVLMYRLCAMKVMNTNDSGPGSLRAALANICNSGTVTFDPSLSGQTIHLASTLVLSHDVILDGGGLTIAVTLSGDTNDDTVGDVRVLEIAPGVTASLNNLTITKGLSDIGAGIYNNDGFLTITASTIVDNYATSYGGGIYSHDFGALYVANSTFASNFDGWGYGGALHNDGYAYILQTTFSDNSVGILNGGNHPATLEMVNTIIANSFSYDCANYGSIGFESNNLVEGNGGSSCGLTDGVNGDIIGLEAYLAPLADNGGPTWTFALMSGSPAINHSDYSGCWNPPVSGFDQRGIARAVCDAGAYEVIDITPPVTTIDSTPPVVTNNTTAVFSFTGSDNFSAPGFLQFECGKDGPWAPCTSPMTYSNLTDGVHTFRVYSTDELGNTLFPNYPFYSWTVDTVAPDTTITSHLPVTVTTTTSTFVNFTFVSPDASVIAYECRLNGGVYSACTGTAFYENLLSRQHTFEVRAIDPAGNADPTPASFTWIVFNVTEKGIIEFTGLPEVITNIIVPTVLNGYVAPPNSLTALTMQLRSAGQVGNTILLNETHAPGVIIAENFSGSPWTPPGDGAYLLSAMATDPISGTATITATLLVDAVSRPAATLNTSVYTGTAYTPGTGILFGGIASDATGVVTATGQLNLGAMLWPLPVRLDESVHPSGYFYGQPIYTSTTWTAAFWVQGDLPDNPPATLSLRLVDASQIPITVTYPIQVDVAPPAIGTINITANGSPIVVGQTYTQTTLFTAASVPPVTDGSAVSLWYGWTETEAATTADLSLVVDPGLGHTFALPFTLSAADGGKVRYFHLIATDAFGNTSNRVFGPYYQDVPSMPEYIGPTANAATYTNWKRACTLLGVDERIPGAAYASPGSSVASLYSAQSLYLTWDATRLHFAWQGANWDVDGDLFIYLDTKPDLASPYQQVGSQGAYDPYTSTITSTVLLLPAREWSNNPNFSPPAGAPAVDGMHADYAVWVKTNQDVRLLRWDNTARTWVDDGSLAALGGAATVKDGTTDLVVPFNQVGNPQNWAAPFPGIGPNGMGVVALAVDAPEGPSQGLRLWSVLPYANPADSARVVVGAPGPDEPHKLMLTSRYVVPVQNGSCFTPEFSPKFFLSSANDAFAFDRFDDSMRLVVPEPSVRANAWNGLFAPYDDVYQAWLTNSYCPDHPTFSGCRITTKVPDPLTDAGLLTSVLDAVHTPLLPGALVTYTLNYVNPQNIPLIKTAYLYTNNNLNNPQSGLTFASQPWIGNCPGWISLVMASGAGRLVFNGTVQASGVTTATLDIGPSYSLGAGCSIVTGDGSAPGYRLKVQHTPDDGPPSLVAIQPSFATVGNGIINIPGTVSDRSPVSPIQIEVTSPNNTVTVVPCTDDTPTDGQWRCPWNVNATAGGTLVNGGIFSLRARAMDVFGAGFAPAHTSAWSVVQRVTVDLNPPSLTPPARALVPGSAASNFPGSEASPKAATPIPTSATAVLLDGQVQDNNLIQSVEVCDAAGANCANAALTVDSTSVPPTFYSYTNAPAAPAPITSAGVCSPGTTGLARTFVVNDIFTVARLEVGLNLSHPYRSDLSARLRGPDGSEIVLFSYARNVLAQNINAFFTDDSQVLLTDDLLNHDLDATYARNTYRPQAALRAFNQKAAAGTWTLTLCDRYVDPDAGLFTNATLYFQAVTPALNVTGSWNYVADVSKSDGIIHSWQVFATDVTGNRSALPYDVSYLVDNIAPVITATQITNRMFANTSIRVLSGIASDGDSVSSLWVSVTDPTGNVHLDSVAGGAGGWDYNLASTTGGEYKLVVMAADLSGNLASKGTFSVEVVLPLEVTQSVTPEFDVKAGSTVAYTIMVANPNAGEVAQNVVITSTLNQYLTPLFTDGASYANHQLTWPVTTLASNETMTLTVLAQMTNQLVISTTVPITTWVDLRGATITSVAGLTTSNLGASRSGQSSFVVEGARQPPQDSAIHITKRVTPETNVQPGSLLTYNIQITNTATITATSLVVSDILAATLTPESLGGANYNSANRTLTWPARSLAPGASVTLTFTARVTTNTSLLGFPFIIPNQAQLSSSLGDGMSNSVWARSPAGHKLFMPLVTRSLTPTALNGPPAVQGDVPVGEEQQPPAAQPPASDWWSTLQTNLAAAWQKIFGGP